MNDTPESRIRKHLAEYDGALQVPFKEGGGELLGHMVLALATDDLRAVLDELADTKTKLAAATRAIAATHVADIASVIYDDDALRDYLHRDAV